MKPEDIEEEALKEIVAKIAGKSSIVIVPILKDKDNVDEFKVAQKAEMTINELRNILYKLHHHDLVSFSRKKDKKKGWFIYYWTLSKERAIETLIKDYNRELTTKKDILENTLKKNYFICARGHTELGEESALEQNFECIECGELLVLKDRDVEKRKLNKIIGVLETRIEELKIIYSKYEKIREAKIEAEKRREVREKARKKLKMRKAMQARAKARKRLAAKTGKKMKKKVKSKSKKRKAGKKSKSSKFRFKKKSKKISKKIRPKSRKKAKPKSKPKKRVIKKAKKKRR